MLRLAIITLAFTLTACQTLPPPDSYVQLACIDEVEATGSVALPALGSKEGTVKGRITQLSIYGNPSKETIDKVLESVGCPKGGITLMSST